MLGLCEDYQEEETTRQDIQKDMEHARRSSVEMIRFALAWDGSHSGPGKFDWSFWDTFFEVAAGEYDMKLVPYLGYTPRWASSEPGDDYWRHPPALMDYYREFVEEAVQRYGDDVYAWELWNEPDSDHYWRGSSEQFSELLKTGHEAIRKYDESVPILFGGLTDTGGEFLERLFREHEADEYVDVVNYHSYLETWNPDPLENLPDYLDWITGIIDDHGSGQDLWMLEVGYSDYRENAAVSEVYRARWEHEHTPEYQAEHFLRTMALVAAAGRVNKLGWYRINDLPYDEPVIGDFYNNRHLGIVDREGAAKPVKKQIKLWQDLFAAAKPHQQAGKIEVEFYPENELEVVKRVLELPEQRTAIFLWIPNRRQPSTGDEELARDSRRADVTIKVPWDQKVVKAREELEFIVYPEAEDKTKISTHLSSPTTAWFILE